MASPTILNAQQHIHRLLLAEIGHVEDVRHDVHAAAGCLIGTDGEGVRRVEERHVGVVVWSEIAQLLVEMTENYKKKLTGRKPKLNPCTHCVMVRFDDEEYARFMARDKESGVYAKFRILSTIYNQIVKEMHVNFSERKTMALMLAYSGDSRSPIPMIAVHSVGDLLYRRQS